MAQRTIDFQSGFSVGTNRSRFLFFDNRRCHFDCGFSTSGFLGDDQTSGFDAHFGKMDSKQERPADAGQRSNPDCKRRPQMLSQCACE